MNQDIIPKRKDIFKRTFNVFIYLNIFGFCFIVKIVYNYYKPDEFIIHTRHFRFKKKVLNQETYFENDKFFTDKLTVREGHI